MNQATILIMLLTIAPNEPNVPTKLLSIQHVEQSVINEQPNCFRALGCYNHQTRTVYVLNTLNEEERQNITSHEKAHYVINTFVCERLNAEQHEELARQLSERWLQRRTKP